MGRPPVGTVCGMPPSIQVGPYTVIALADGAGPFFSPRSEAFPGATTEQWAAADQLDPGALDADGRWRLQFRAFAIRSDQGRGAPGFAGPAGIEPSDVDTVVLTHTDHVGWTVVGGEQTRPFFPNAEYLLQQAELDAIEEVNPQLRSHMTSDRDRAIADRLGAMIREGGGGGHQLGNVDSAWTLVARVWHAPEHGKGPAWEETPPELAL